MWCHAVTGANYRQKKWHLRIRSTISYWLRNSFFIPEWFEQKAAIPGDTQICFLFKSSCFCLLLIFLLANHKNCLKSNSYKCLPDIPILVALAKAVFHFLNQFAWRIASGMTRTWSLNGIIIEALKFGQCIGIARPTTFTAVHKSWALIK